MSTAIQANITGVLEQLGFESEGAEMPGADVFFAITPETIATLARHMQEGTKVVVSSDSISVVMT